MDTHTHSDGSHAPEFKHGRELLAAWLEQSGIRATDFASRIPISQSHMSRILAGKVNASDWVRLRFEQETEGSVPFGSWRPVAKPTEESAA